MRRKNKNDVNREGFGDFSAARGFLRRHKS